MLEDVRFVRIEIADPTILNEKVDKAARRLFPHVVTVEEDRIYDASWTLPARSWIKSRIGSESSRLVYNTTMFFIFSLEAQWDYHRNRFYFRAEREATLFLLRWG